MEKQSIYQEEPFARRVIGCINPKGYRWVVLLECGHTYRVLARGPENIPNLFLCQFCQQASNTQDR